MDAARWWRRATWRRATRSETGTYYWRALGKPQLEHEGKCVFRREERAREYEAEEHREARRAPDGLVSILRNSGG